MAGKCRLDFLEVFSDYYTQSVSIPIFSMPWLEDGCVSVCLTGIATVNSLIFATAYTYG